MSLLFDDYLKRWNLKKDGAPIITHSSQLLPVIYRQHGWLAIDPKHVRGERGYDFANLFCNPDSEIALKPGRFQKQLQTVADCANLDKIRLLKWILAYSALSAAWSLEYGDSPELALTVAKIAARACVQVAIETLSQKTSVFSERTLKAESLKHSLLP